VRVPEFFYCTALGILVVTCPFFLHQNFFKMPECKKNGGQTNNSSLPTEDAALHAAEVIRNFILFYPPDVAKEALWQLFSTSLSGPGADDWNGHERSNMLLFYRLAGELVEALPGLVPASDRPTFGSTGADAAPPAAPNQRLS
jgi:hypothetical protein